MPPASRARLAALSVLRTARLPQTQDTALPAVPRTQGLPGHDDRRDGDPAGGRNTSAPASPCRAHTHRPPDDRAVATMVARELRGTAVLASSTCRVHAAGWCGPHDRYSARRV